MTVPAVITAPSERLFTVAEVTAAIDPWRAMLTEAHVRITWLIRENRRLRSAHLLCDMCGAQPCVNPSFCAACRAAEAKPAPPKLRPQPRPTPQTLVEAIMYCVREHGVKALKEPKVKSWLHECDAAAKAQINARIQKLIEAKRIAHD